MTPPAEGERAREIVEGCVHVFYPTDWRGRGVKVGACVDCIAAALRAPQPRGLTGDAIRDAADEVLAELTAMFGRFTDKQSALFDLLRALNLSAIEGAPAAGEREVADVLVSKLHDVFYSNDFDLTAAETREYANGLIWKLHDVLRAPASPRSAAPEDK